MSRHRLCLLAFVFIVQASLLHAGVRLPAIISDHMVLSRSASAPIWGTADAKEDVSVTLAGKTARTQAGSDGRWSVRMDVRDCGVGPFDLLVQGKNSIRVSDVVVGTVWLASGQSNMEFSLQAAAGGEKEIAQAANPLLRQFHVKKVACPTPADDCVGTWTIASPETAGDFTAVGYYFGKRLQQELKIPVGIINASWGGTYSEAWTSIEGLNQVDSLRTTVELRRKTMAEYPAKKRAFVDQFATWLKAQEREDRPLKDVNPYVAEHVPAGGWTSVKLPGLIAGAGLPSNGAVWLRRQVDVPDAAVGHGQPFKILLGYLTGFEQVYWNGTKVSETPYPRYPGEGYVRYFEVPTAKVRIGANTLAVRIYAPTAAPAVITPPGRFWAGPISLEGAWQAKAEYDLPPLPAKELATVPKPPSRPPTMPASGIFNGVIHPIVPYGIAGVVWYQGESNAGRAYDYRVAFPLLINDWRAKWHDPQLPFYYCQLANFGPTKTAPMECEWAELRESQACALRLPATGQAVLIGLGESDDIHPRNKRDVGDRLARLALARQYGKPLAFSGPVYASMQIEGDRIRVKFGHTEKGLVASTLPPIYEVVSRLGKTAPLVRNSPTSELEGFAICAADRRWVWAEAKIEGDCVVVWSAAAPHPVAVRYAWADNPTCNLANGEGLPASPFRTDDFPALTAKHHFGVGN